MDAKGHRSFRISAEPYMAGKRVIPRLFYARWAAALIQTATIVGSLAAFFAFIGVVPAFRPNSRPLGIVGALGPFFIAWLSYYLGFRLSKYVAQRFGWLTEAEALEFQWRMSRWPESWLEEKP